MVKNKQDVVRTATDNSILEIWKDIPGWESLYQASNKGRVRSLDRLVHVNVFGKYNGQEMKKGKVLKLVLHNGAGHHPEYIVCLSKNGKAQNEYVHRLVALAFIPNPDNLPEVNHKDENSLNNYVENLEWCDRAYNCTYGTRTERAAKSNSKNRLCKTVLQYTVDGVFLQEWPSVHEIERELGYSQGSVSYCCKFNGNQSHGYKWRYKNDFPSASSEG